EEVLGRVDPQRLLEDPERRVPGDVQREQAGRPDRAVVAQPDEEGHEREVEDQLVQERRVERAVRQVPRRPVGGRDLQPPGTRGRRGGATGGAAPPRGGARGGRPTPPFGRCRRRPPPPAPPRRAGPPPPTPPPPSPPPRPPRHTPTRAPSAMPPQMPRPPSQT